MDEDVLVTVRVCVAEGVPVVVGVRERVPEPEGVIVPDTVTEMLGVHVEERVVVAVRLGVDAPVPDGSCVLVSVGVDVSVGVCDLVDAGVAEPDCAGARGRGYGVGRRESATKPPPPPPPRTDVADLDFDRVRV